MIPHLLRRGEGATLLIVVNEPDLQKLFKDTADIMLAEYELFRMVQHRPSKGEVREAIVLDRFLSKHMPRNVNVCGNTEARSVDGRRSPSGDIFVVDKNAPFLVEHADYRIAAIENVFGVVEVKSKLDCEQLRKAYESIVELKRMPKTAFLPASGPQWPRHVYGRTWTHMPTVGLIFAYEGVRLETLCREMAEIVGEYRKEPHLQEPHLQVDSVWVLKKGGSLTWADPKNNYRINPSPEPGDEIHATRSTPGQVLLHMVAHLNVHFANAWTPGFDFLRYVGNSELGTNVAGWKP